MRYAVYMKYVDGLVDSTNCDNRAERDILISNIKRFDYVTDADYCPIYKSGEYGNRVNIKGKKWEAF